MVNYVLSFCKITGASKIFSRNFYLPLLKPLTPREALRTFRITGKWLLGSKIQHYIPVLLNSREKNTRKTKKQHKKAYNNKEKSVTSNDYSYMTPVFDPENENHQILLNLLTKYNQTTNNSSNEDFFIYKVDDKKYNIILEARFEIAIRDGEIIDILVSQKNDKIIVKLKNMKKIPMEIQYYDNNNNNNNNNNHQLYYGEGSTTPEEEKFHHHGKYTMSLVKTFEDKELIEEKWEEELKKIMRKRRKHNKQWKSIMKDSLKNLNWQKFEMDAKKVIEEINEPVEEKDIEMEIDDLEKTKNVNETLSTNQNLLNNLPTISEIPDIIKGMASAELQENNENQPLSGVKVKLSNGKECFVSGQMVHTDDGDVFVPGQTIESEYGLEYAPGITINVDNKPILINGLIMGEEEREPMFLPTESAITADGQLTFATAPEERPKPLPENERLEKELKKKKKKREMMMLGAEGDENMSAEETEEIKEDEEDNRELDEEGEESNEKVIINSNGRGDENENKEEDDEDEEKSSSIELSNSEMEELDIEAIRQKHEQQRLEIEKLKQILLDDGMDDLITSLEEKKMKLKQKLDELRKLSLNKENNLISYINDDDTIEIAMKITKNEEYINRISNILMSLTERTATFRDKNSINSNNISLINIIVNNMNEIDKKFNNSSKKLKVLLKTCVVAANDIYKNRPKDQVLALNTIGDIMIDIMKNDEKIIKEMINLMTTTVERNEIVNAIYKQLTQNINKTITYYIENLLNKTDLINESDEIFNILEKILDKDSTNIKCQAFIKIAKVDTEALNILIKTIKSVFNQDKIKTEQDAIDIIENSISKTIKQLTEKNLTKLLNDKTTNNDFSLNELKEEALSFAKALDLDGIVENLNSTTNLSNSLDDEKTRTMLKRMILIKQLAERDYSLKTSIHRLKRNPDCSRTDPRIRQLIRESALLIASTTTVKKLIRNSRDIPLQLIKNQNYLAIENYLIENCDQINLPILINRNQYQAVIPKEAARGVLAGRVPYILIDESGITNFKPMHMFNAINLNNKQREQRIDNYLNGGLRDDNNRQYLQSAKSNVRKLKKFLNKSRHDA